MDRIVPACICTTVLRGLTTGVPRSLVITEPSARNSYCSRSRSAIARASIAAIRSEEHTSELQSLMRNSYAVFCLKKNKKTKNNINNIVLNHRQQQNN